MKKIMVMTLALSFWLCGQALCEPVVVVNSGVGVSSLNADDIQKIFLGKKVKWESGENITPVTLESGPVHENFLKSYIKKNSSQFSNYWKQMIFTGQGTSPKAVASEVDIVKFVKDTPGGIGYIDSATPHGDVKAVEVK